MRRLLLPFLLLATGPLVAQGLSLDSAIAQALRHDRLQQQLALMDSLDGLRDTDLGRSRYPRIGLNATSTWQNEQIAIPLDLPVPGFSAPEAPLDLHRALLELDQTIYAGNRTQAEKRVQDLEADGARLVAEARSIDLKTQVVQRFMGVLLGEEQLRLLTLKDSTLDAQRARLDAAVDAGAALAVEADVIRAEQLRTAQDRIQAEARCTQLRGELVRLTGNEAARTVPLIRPAADAVPLPDPAQRPDIRVFDMREQALDAQLDLRRSARRPTLHAFASAGGGLPGYNLFDDRFRPMAMAGLKLQWNFLDWGVTRRAEAGAGLQRAMLEQERDRALRQINITLDAQQVKIAELDRLIEKDDALIALLGGVVRTKGNQLALGTATASDYLTELNKENAARLGREMHQLQRLLAIRLQLNIAGQ